MYRLCVEASETFVLTISVSPKLSVFALLSSSCDKNLAHTVTPKLWYDVYYLKIAELTEHQGMVLAQ